MTASSFPGDRAAAVDPLPPDPYSTLREQRRALVEYILAEPEAVIHLEVARIRGTIIAVVLALSIIGLGAIAIVVSFLPVASSVRLSGIESVIGAITLFVAIVGFAAGIRVITVLRARFVVLREHDRVAPTPSSRA